MTEAIPNFTAQPAASAADKANDELLEAKLRAAAARARRQVEERRAQGMPATLAEIIEAKLRSQKLLVGDEGIPPQFEPPDEQCAQAVRIPPEEGDRPAVAPAINIALRAAIVPPRFTSVSFESYQPSTRGQSKALDAASLWLGRALRGEPAMLALIGPQGTGKSHLLYAAANRLLSEGRRCYARPWYRLADELRYGGDSPFVPGRTMEASEVRAMLDKQKIVLIDEVRPTASTAFDDTELAKFACHAYDANLAVLITTNVNPLSDVMGPPAASRFAQVIIDGPDRRQT